MAHDGAKQRLHHASRRVAACMDDQPRPAAVVRRRQHLRICAYQAVDVVGPLENDRGGQRDCGAAVDEQPHHLVLADQRRLIQGREADGILQIQVSAELDQRGDRFRPSLDDRQMQRRAAVIRPIHPLVLLIENDGDAFRVSPAGGGEQRVQRAFARCAVSERLLESDPALMTAFARERVLNVAKRDRFRRIGVRAREPRACIRIAVVQRFQPALCSLPQVVEGAHGTPPSVRCLASAYFRPEEGSSWRSNLMGGRRLPCRGQEAPQCALRSVCGNDCQLSNEVSISGSAVRRINEGTI